MYFFLFGSALSLLQVVLLLGACPFPERLNLPWFSTALAALGPRFHALSVRVALGIPRPAARTAAVLGAIGEGGVPLNVVLDELCPLPAGGRSDTWSGGEVLANQVRVWARRWKAFKVVLIIARCTADRLSTSRLLNACV